MTLPTWTQANLLHLSGGVLLESLQVSLSPPELRLSVLCLQPTPLQLGLVLVTESLVLRTGGSCLSQLLL